MPLPRAGRVDVLVDAVAVAASCTQIGHTLMEPRLARGTLLTLHPLAAAFRVGALGPSHRAAATAAEVPLLHAFAVVAPARWGF